jgi:cytochrome c biogenesis protein CcmG/thiol:disulfide interchange protein DsbE
MSSSASTEPASPEPDSGPGGQRPNRTRRRLLSLGIGLVLAGGLWLGLTAFTVAPVKKEAPFSLPRLGSGPRVTVPLVGEGAHEPVVLTFFASWCGPCHSELPKLAAVAREASASHKSVRFIGIDDNDAPASGLAFARKSGVTFPVGRDALSRVAPSFGVQWNPSTVFIDGDGVIAKTVRGPVTAAVLKAEIARLERT